MSVKAWTGYPRCNAKRRSSFGTVTVGTTSSSVSSSSSSWWWWLAVLGDGNFGGDGDLRGGAVVAFVRGFRAVFLVGWGAVTAALGEDGREGDRFAGLTAATTAAGHLRLSWPGCLQREHFLSVGGIENVFVGMAFNIKTQIFLFWMSEQLITKATLKIGSNRKPKKNTTDNNWNGTQS